MDGSRWMRRTVTAFGASLTVAGACLGAGAGVSGAASSGSAASLTTAWRGGQFVENPEAVVSRSDIVLGQPNFSDTQSLPLGNGRLGVAAWAQNGFTAQLNRDDTFPNRWSPGQVNIPGLAAMTSAQDFQGRLDLNDGVLEESGGGMTLEGVGRGEHRQADHRCHRRRPDLDADRVDQSVARTATRWPRRRARLGRCHRQWSTTPRTATAARRSGRWRRSPPAAATSAPRSPVPSR